ncbi:prenyltransferase [Mycobacterium sp. WUMAC-067]|uniref:prenyltransferase n=1 Tax=unclassified Mycobacterium TaxID=2642494 RepID=UPI001CD9EE63|nr:MULTISPECIES: prenyltransferase [unclassified Mycobacterium]MCA2244812.1 prenyltransferase [Mycobacterium sp. WUMAC-067]MCA2316132.1 prenyltransferase [Mycobacterium sp. WUMAC-025]
MHRSNLPAVAGVLTPEQCRQTALSIAAAQESSGAIPWFDGGHTDPWDHVECAMALTTAGLLEPARAAFDWSRRTQRSDGSWPIQFRAGVIEDANSDSNFCAYIAAGVWHHVLVTGDASFAAEMWPVVHKAIDFVIDMQIGNGEIAWARSEAGLLPEALLTGCSSVFHSIRCALALAAFVDDPQPEWELAVGRLGHAITDHPEAFTEKERYSMDWYYPILGSALRGPAAAARIKQRWDDFVVDGLGIRCVGDRPWVTGAETCELVMALDALGQRQDAHRQFAAMQHLREDDGSYWTGLVFADGKRWPEERTTWTGAAMILAADALSGATGGAGIFRGDALPMGLQTDFDCECVVTGPGR